ncbi:MAG: hypothetical protein ABEJ79_03545 [Halolamina sp.]
MQPLQFLVPVGALDAVERLLPFVIFGLVVANMVTRALAHRSHERQAQNADDGDLSRYLPHTLSTAALVVASFLFTVVEPHGGIVLSVLVLGAFVSDFFEFEARQVEARNDMTIERPKASLTVSVLVLLYAGYQALFFLIAPLWNAVV